MSRHLALHPASPDDREFLFQVYAATRAEELALFGWDTATQEEFLRMQFDARARSYRAAYPSSTEHVIVSDGQPAGSIMVSENDGGFRLVDIALLPENRRQGIGSRLISDLLTKATSLGWPVRLSVLLESPAIALYERLGFAVISAGPMYLEMECRRPRFSQGREEPHLIDETQAQRPDNVER